MMQSPFAVVKDAGISALDVARRYCAIASIHRSNRNWACCVFHDEKTPSLLFDGNGRFHCFGCGVDGDAIEFLSRLQNIPTVEAANKICCDFGIAFKANAECSTSTHQVLRKRQVQALADQLQQELIRAAYGAICEVLRAADRYCSLADPDSAWEDPGFIEHVRLLGDCEIWLDILSEEDDAAAVLATQLTEAVKHAK